MAGIMKITVVSCLLVVSASVWPWQQMNAAQTVPSSTQTPVATGAPAKQSRDEFLESMLDGARERCMRAIVATAKDPDSVKFLDDGGGAPGRALMRNHLLFDFEIMGRNTYGAVLRHTLHCDVPCKINVGCYDPLLSE
jgi:hypothetical protein